MGDRKTQAQGAARSVKRQARSRVAGHDGTEKVNVMFGWLERIGERRDECVSIIEVRTSAKRGVENSGCIVKPLKGETTD